MKRRRRRRRYRQARQAACAKAGVVLLLAIVVTKIFEQRRHHLASAHATPRLTSSPTHSSMKCTCRPPSSSSTLAAIGFKRGLGAALALGPSPMRQARSPWRRHSRSCGWSALCAGCASSSVDVAVLHRHVQIGAHQHALALDVEPIDGADAGKVRFAPAVHIGGAGNLRVAMSSYQPAHGDCGIAHAVGEAPFIVIPGHDAAEIAVDDLRRIQDRKSSLRGCD